MAKSESEAASIFKAKLSEAVTKQNVIYIITEKEQLAFAGGRHKGICNRRT